MNDERTSKYIVCDSYLADVVLWTNQLPSHEKLCQRLRDCSFIEWVAKLRPIIYLGPIESQTEVKNIPPSVSCENLPLVIHLHPEGHDRFIVFMYVNEGSIELHIPENFFVTGVMAEDCKRVEYCYNLATSLAEQLEISWDHIENPDITIEESFSRKLWQEVEHSVFSRIEVDTHLRRDWKKIDED